LAQKKKRKRLDELVCEAGFADSSEDAERLIRAGQILVNSQREDKPGGRFPEDAEIRCTSRKKLYVSRGGLKMQAALQGFEVNIQGMRCLDVGIGTGGFTDCLLQHGAKHVTGVDVGYGDVAWSLRNDSRVVLRERSNFRVINVEILEPPFDLAVVDCSFISLEVLLPNLALSVAADGMLIALVKPQFEAGKSKVEDGGLVTNTEIRAEITERIKNAAAAVGFSFKRQMDCPVHGARAGNVEILVLFSRNRS